VGPGLAPVGASIDCADVYERQRLDLLAIVGALGDGGATAAVPATPTWSVHDVVAHLVGITADLGAGYFGVDDADADAWTARQVASRRDRTMVELAAEWEDEAARFEDGLRLLGYEIGCHFVGDLVQHSLDVREATGAAPITDRDALVAALDHYLGAFHDALVQHAAGSVPVRSAGEEWLTGSGPVVATISADPVVLLRSLGGRRTTDERGALAWTGDADRVRPLVNVYR